MKTITQSKLHYYGIVFFTLFLILTIIISCSKTRRSDGVFPGTKELDSVTTEKQLANMLNGSYATIDERVRYSYPSLKRRKDKRYLPYLFLSLTDTHLPPHVRANYNLMLYDLCMSKNDSLFYIGRLCTDLLNKKMKRTSPVSAYYPFEDEEDKDKYRRCPVNIDEEVYDLDSLRISVIGFNDRNALSLLEKYYNEIKLEKELAVYYKIMLRYEGNGDLAEKYYYVLRPYLADQPEFFNGIREVLLRAAICDGNERAQELCDSLGISFCDYRLPLPE